MTQEMDDEERFCAGCGATESQWTENGSFGFTSRNGEIYCCRICAEGKTCTCNPAKLDSLIKKRSA